MIYIGMSVDVCISWRDPGKGPMNNAASLDEQIVYEP